MISPSVTSLTWQPWCVHVEEKATYSPLVGWATTTSASAKITALPTGTSLVAPRGVPPPPPPPSPPPSWPPPSPELDAAAVLGSPAASDPPPAPPARKPAAAAPPPPPTHR